MFDLTPLKIRAGKEITDCLHFFLKHCHNVLLLNAYFYMSIIKLTPLVAVKNIRKCIFIFLCASLQCVMKTYGTKQAQVLKKIIFEVTSHVILEELNFSECRLSNL